MDLHITLRQQPRLAILVEPGLSIYVMIREVILLIRSTRYSYYSEKHMPRGIRNSIKATMKKVPSPKLTLRSVAETHTKATATAQKVEKQAAAWLEKATTAFAKAEAALEKHAAQRRVTAASRAAAAKARAAKKEAAGAIKSAKAELKIATRATKKLLAAERKVVAAEAKLLSAKAKHETLMLVALAKLETKLAKDALKSFGQRLLP